MKTGTTVVGAAAACASAVRLACVRRSKSSHCAAKDRKRRPGRPSQPLSSSAPPAETEKVQPEALPAESEIERTAIEAGQKVVNRQKKI